MTRAILEAPPQLDLDLARANHESAENAADAPTCVSAQVSKLGRGEIARGDPMPDGPFRVGMMHGPNGALEWPYTVVCGDGRAIAGHVPSRECAEAIVDALNQSGQDRTR
ncbi:MAG TPA: hypothetical protein VEW06_06275 [Xanthobacteraceae bacterium]|nr:hypothetical protein [Xanthobacteraceae bacterium]